MEDRAERVIESPLETIKDRQNNRDCCDDDRLDDRPDRLNNICEEPLESRPYSLQTAIERGDEVLVPPRDEPSNNLADAVPDRANGVLVQPGEHVAGRLDSIIDCGDEVLVPPRDEPSNSLANPLEDRTDCILVQPGEGGAYSLECSVHEVPEPADLFVGED